MNPITKIVTIPADHNLHLEVAVPKEIPAGEAEVVLQIISKSKSKDGGSPNRLKSIYGAAKGEVWMADDFDQPLDGFAALT